jgi:hypothetical protein
MGCALSEDRMILRGADILEAVVEVLDPDDKNRINETRHGKALVYSGAIGGRNGELKLMEA